MKHTLALFTVLLLASQVAHAADFILVANDTAPAPIIIFKPVFYSSEAVFLKTLRKAQRIRMSSRYEIEM